LILQGNSGVNSSLASGLKSSVQWEGYGSGYSIIKVELILLPCSSGYLIQDVSWIIDDSIIIAIRNVVYGIIIVILPGFLKTVAVGQKWRDV
jgi:hypothetical protein